MDGVVGNVCIMLVCVVFNGDECDKDVVNVICYVVDNGVIVINMSFGKGYLFYKDVVDDVVCYVLSKDVVLVYVVGNDGKENQFDNNYLNDKFECCGLFCFKYVENWIEVGVMILYNDEILIVSFFNWSVDKVDVFVLGIEIYVIVFDDGY